MLILPIIDIQLLTVGYGFENSDLQCMIDCIRATKITVKSIWMRQISQLYVELYRALQVPEVGLADCFEMDETLLYLDTSYRIRNIECSIRNTDILGKLIEEWHCGRRNITHFSIFEGPNWSTWAITVASWKEFIRRFRHVEVKNENEHEIQFLLEREEDEKILEVTFAHRDGDCKDSKFIVREIVV